MTTSTLRLSERYAEYYPGYKLLSCESAALPLFKVVFRALVRRGASFSPIEEFLLRAIGLGLRSSQEISLMLGVDEGIIDNCLTSMWQRDLIDSPSLAGVRGFRLTTQGQLAIAELREMVSSEEDLTFFYDRVLLAPRAIDPSAVIFGDLDEISKLREISDRKKKKVELDDLKLDQINRTLEMVEGTYDTEVLNIRHIVSQTKVSMRCDLLIFESLDAIHHRVDIAVDERIQADYGRTIEEIGIEKYLEIKFERPVVETSSEYKQLKALQEKIQIKAVHTNRERYEQLPDLDSLNDSSVDERVVDSTTGRPTNIEKVGHRILDTFEHPEFLEEATRRASQRLLIISPWVKNSVVNRNFCRALESLAKKNVLIHIGYGLVDKFNPDEKNNQLAVEILQKLSDEFPNVFVAFLGNTHAKFLLWDNNFITTSFNWLSFVGDQSRTYRQEMGTLLRNSPQVEDVWRENSKWIEQKANKVAFNRTK